VLPVDHVQNATGRTARRSGIRLGRVGRDEDVG
jgi:hypothetical protein